LPTTFVLPNGLTYAGTWTWQYSIAGTTYPVGGRDTYLGPVVVTQRHNPVSVTYLNNLGYANTSNVLFYAASVDQTIHWADPLGCMMTPGCNRFLNYVGPIPTVTHLHGGEVPSDFDGTPDQWFTNPMGIKGPSYRSDMNFAIPSNGAVYTYPNGQEAAPLWFHDHVLGVTRLNVYAGLAALYMLTDPLNEPAGLPAPVPIAIQDRMFDTNGQLYFPNLGINPTVHPFWIPEFFGDVIVVNGKSWPKMQVEPRRYRLVLLNGSNARFYTLSISESTGRKTRGSRPGPAFYQIGSDGGYLNSPVMLNQITIAPGERSDVIVDFSAFAGKNLIMKNSAKAPFPAGTPADPQTVGQVMMFQVSATPVADASCNPALGGCARPTPIVDIKPAQGAVPVRRLTLNEVMGAGGPLEVLVNNTKWDGLLSANIANQFADGISELPRVGATEIWEIVNLTADTHPIHLHLVQFQLINRQDFQTRNYQKVYNAAFGTTGTAPLPVGCVAGQYCPAYGPPLPYGNCYDPITKNPIPGAVCGGNPDVTPFLGAIRLPDPNEVGWKDTFRMNPGQVTRIAVRWAPQDILAGGVTAGTNLYPFDPTGLTQYAVDSLGVLVNGPGYVWHCHILDHEDNEMMRPYYPVP